ncbi:MAG: hypothetical protein IJ323_02825 [Clostridia bacterium]|nr:hypothetical protein [Clostridia bacterium]
MKRLLALLLALVMTVSTFALVSCDKGEDTPDGTKSDNSKDNYASDVEGDIFAERAAVDDELGEYDFGGREFRLATYYDTMFVPDPADKNKGNLITDAKFSALDAAESRFNFKTTVAYSGIYYDVVEWVSKNVLSGADEFDLFCSHSASAGGLVLKNVFLNWYDIPNVDFTKPWWASSCQDELTYDGKCILAVSDFNYNALSGAYCMIFNKNLASAYDFGNLYEVVMDGDWTFDYFYNLIKDVYVDSDGSGTRTEGDFYGYAQAYQYNCPINAWLWAFDNPIAAKDADGVPVVAVKTDKINSIVQKIYDLCLNTNGVHWVADNESKQGMDIFLDRKAIITMGSVGSPTGEGLRNFEDEYGLLPLPKWDENQQNYYTMTAGEHSVMAVPKTCKDTEFVGTCIEVLSAENYKKVIPTLYETALKTRYLRDNESKEVLDIILEGRVYDFGYIYGGFEGFGFMLGQILYDENPNFESYYAEKYRKARNHLKKITKVFDKLS